MIFHSNITVLYMLFESILAFILYDIGLNLIVGSIL